MTLRKRLVWTSALTLVAIVTFELVRGDHAPTLTGRLATHWPYHVAFLAAASIVVELSRRAVSHTLRSRPSWLINLYPPLLGAGIRVSVVSRAPLQYQVRMPLTWMNRNALGTQFGGSMFAMTDPFYMLILMHELGPGYIVWDEEATISFLRPGRSTVRADFRIPPERVEAIRAECAAKRITHEVFDIEIRDDSDTVVAKISKRIYVRKRRT